MPNALAAMPAATAKSRMVVSTNFPADDRSVGYERGTGVSKEWELAVLDAAIAVAEQVEAKLGELSGAREGGNGAERIEKLKAFAQRFMNLCVDNKMALLEIERYQRNIGGVRISVRRFEQTLAQSIERRRIRNLRVNLGRKKREEEE